jgi:hypothetical protein
MKLLNISTLLHLKEFRNHQRCIEKNQSSGTREKVRSKRINLEKKKERKTSLSKNIHLSLKKRDILRLQKKTVPHR